MKFNGHKNWNHCNVSLWVNNDEGLYHMAMELCRNNTRPARRQSAPAARMLSELNGMGIYKTDDGAPFSVSSIRAAMVGIL